MKNNLVKENKNNYQINKLSNIVSSKIDKNKDLLIKLLKEQLDIRLTKLEKRNKNHLIVIKLTSDEIRNITNWSIYANKQIKDKLKKDKDKEKEKLLSQSKSGKSKKKDSTSTIRKNSLFKTKTPVKGKNFKSFLFGENKAELNRNKITSKSFINSKSTKSFGNRTKSFSYRKKNNNTNNNKTINNINLNEDGLLRTPSIISNKSNKSNQTTTLNKTQKVKKNNLKINNNKNEPPIRKKTPYKKRNTTTRNEKIEGLNNIKNLTSQNSIKSEIIKKHEKKKSNHEINMNKMESALQNDDLFNNNDPLLILPITDFDFEQNGKLSSTKNLNSEINNVEKEHVFNLNVDKIINKNIFNIISDYLSIYDLIQLKNISKNFNNLFYPYIIKKLQNDKEYFINKKNNLDLNVIPPILTIKDFVLSKGSIKAIKLLNEPHLNYIFSEKSDANSDRTIIYRVFFQLINHPLKYIPYYKKEEFWQKCQHYFSHENNGKTGELIQKTFDEKMIDIEGNNLYKIYKLVYKDLRKIHPSYYSNICGTTGLFTFFIKDILDFVGISDDLKIQSKAYWSYAKIIDSIEKKIDYIKKLKNI